MKVPLQDIVKKDVSMISILDCDDVLLDFMGGLTPHLRGLGYDLDPAGPNSWDLSTWIGTSKSHAVELIRDFIEKEGTGFDDLAPMPGAVEAVHALRQAGYSIMVVSSFSDQPGPKDRRMANLERDFGAGVFSDLIGLPLGASKHEVLSRLPHGLYIDDVLTHARAAAEVGHDAYWMRAHHNWMDFDKAPNVPGVTLCADWSEAMDLLDPLLRRSRAERSLAL